MGIGSLVYIINLLIAPVANFLMRLGSQGKEPRIFVAVTFFKPENYMDVDIGLVYELRGREANTSQRHEEVSLPFFSPNSSGGRELWIDLRLACLPSQPNYMTHSASQA